MPGILAQQIVYSIGSKIYINITNRCNCSCIFCVKFYQDGIAGARLKFDTGDPSLEEIKEAIAAINLADYEEVVFCGFGEPLMRYNDLLLLTKYIKENYSPIFIRINTNGLGDLINKKDTISSLSRYIDAMSISLNAQNADVYARYTRSRHEATIAYETMLNAIEHSVKSGLKTTATVVYGIEFAEIDLEQCKEIATKLGADFKIRNF